MKILCLKHIAFEGPGTIALWAQQRGHELHIESVDQNKSLPALTTFDVLLIMGGPMNVYQDAQYPWLETEKNYIRAAIDSGKYVIGICLGAQLIAHTLGAAITQGAHKEIGWFPIQPSADCPTAMQLPDELRVLHWPGDTFALPNGAHPIAASAAKKTITAKSPVKNRLDGSRARAKSLDLQNPITAHLPPVRGAG